MKIVPSNVALLTRHAPISTKITASPPRAALPCFSMFRSISHVYTTFSIRPPPAERRRVSAGAELLHNVQHSVLRRLRGGGG